MQSMHDQYLGTAVLSFGRLPVQQAVAAARTSSAHAVLNECLAAAVSRGRFKSARAAEDAKMDHWRWQRENHPDMVHGDTVFVPF
eukprot:SAG11_NODE_11344_length_767_cov_0.904192_2_plen_84_part_01